MKRKILLLIATLLIAISGFSQTTLPDSVVDKIIDELIVKDGLVKDTANLKAQLREYVHTDSLLKDKLVLCEDKNKEKDVIITSLKELLEQSKVEIKDCKRNKRITGIKSFFIGTGTGAVLTVLVIILL